MKRKILALFAVALAAAGVACLAFVNNVAATVRWWRAFAALGGDAAAVPAKADGVFPWLAWSVVDYSTVTTLIPALGFSCIAFSLFRMLLGRRMSPGDFPFFRGSDQLNIALGLLGTLWGIIVIGYFRLDTVSMANLMQCLHTALYSTLMAVVWVFLLDRPLLRPFLTRLLERSGLAETDDGNLAQAVDRLVARLGAASDAFDRRQREYEAAFERRLAEYERQFAERKREYDEFFARRIAELERAAAEERGRADRARARLGAVAKAMNGAAADD